MGYLPVPVDDHGVWQGAYVVTVGFGQFDDFQFAGQYRVVHPVFRDELAHFFRFLQGDADKLQPLRPVLLLQRDKLGDFLQTGRAPGCPEVQRDHLAVPLGDRALPAVQVRQGEFGSADTEDLRFHGGLCPCTGCLRRRAGCPLLLVMIQAIAQVAGCYYQARQHSP